MTRKSTKIVYWLDVVNSKKKIDNWLNVDWFRRTKKSIIDCRCNRLIDVDWFSKQENRLLNRFVDMKMLYVNFSFNSRKFVLWFRDFFKKFELKIKWNTFIVFKKKTSHIDDFFLFRVFLRTIRRFSFEHSRIFTSDKNFVSTRFFYEQLTIFFNYSRIFTSISGDFI